MPVFLFIILAGAEMAMLGSAKLRQDAATVEAARWTVAHPDASAIPDGLGLGGCDVTESTDVDDGLVTVSATCEYHPVALHGIWEGLDVSSEASAAMAGEVLEATGTPTPSEVAP